MTKLRAPLTFELALTRVAAVIGWDQVGKLAGQAARTVHTWSEPDAGPAAGRAISLDLALQLDVACKAAGGDGAPMWECYSRRLELGTSNALFCNEQIALSTAKASVESGEGIAAAIAAARPGASQADLIFAERQLEESIAAQSDTLAKIRAGRTSDVRCGAKAPPPGEGI